jgi:predicted  nucleic acid-binding Zn-ribbon protein
MAADSAANDVGTWTLRIQSLEELNTSWKGYGLSIFQRGAAESDALRIAANTELVAAGRREVSGQTRDFAKLDPEQKLAQLGSLVKGYQTYVDEVTRALKHAESAHKNVHSYLKQLSDPYPVLERFLRHKAALLSLLKGSDSADSLRKQLRDREAELAELTNQEVTIRHLREQIAELELQATVDEGQQEANASAEVAQVLRQWQERENAVQKELAMMSQECRRVQLFNNDLKAQLESTTEDLQTARIHADKAADEAAHEIEELRIALGTAQHDRERMHEQLVALQQQLPSSRSPGRQRAAGDETPPRPSHDEVTPPHQRIGGPPAAPSAAAAAAFNHPDAASLQARINTLTTDLKIANTAREATQQQLATALITIDGLNKSIDNAERRLDGAAADHQRALSVLEAELHGARAEIAALRQRLGESDARNAELRTMVVDLQSDLSAAERLHANATAPKEKVAKPFDLGTVVVNVDGPPATGDAPSRDRRSVETDEHSHGGSNDGGESERVAALIAQRDNLRRRLHALEDVGVTEVKELRAQLETLKRENQEMQNTLNGARRDPLADEIQPAPRHAPSLFGLAQQSAVDRAASIVSHLVLSSRQSRRAFAAYQLVLHVVLVLLLAYYIL